VRKPRVGLVGLGAVAQIVHLPVLKNLTEQFEIVAGCDISLPLAKAVGARYGIPNVYGSHRDMLTAESLDVIAVLNSDEYHAECAIDALDAGCHVLIEKPVCLTLRQVDEIIAARNKANRHVMVGYMRRYAQAYQDMQAHLRYRTDIQHVSVRDIIGPNAYFIDQTTPVLTEEIPEAAKHARAALAAEQVRESVGDVTPDIAKAFRLLSGLSSHDLSALRGLVGTPVKVRAASCHRDGRYISALLDYGHFTATFETGIDQVGRFDAYIEVFTGDQRVRVDYDTPYIRHLPTHFSVASSEGDGFTEVRSRPTLRDPYTNQWLAFWRALNGMEPITTTLEDAAEDVRLAIAITAACQA